MNKFIFCGRLTKDVEFAYSQNKLAIAKISVALDRRVKANEEKQADFFICTAFDKKAEFINKYFSKGVRVLLEGHVQNRTWEDKEGQKRYVTDFIVDNCEFADGGKQKQENNQVNENLYADGTPRPADDDLPF